MVEEDGLEEVNIVSQSIKRFLAQSGESFVRGGEDGELGVGIGDGVGQTGFNDQVDQSRETGFGGEFGNVCAQRL